MSASRHACGSAAGPDRAVTGGDRELGSRVVTLAIGVLALQGDVREHVHALTAVGATAVPVRRERELDAVDALVLPGGESTTMDKLLRAFDLFEPVRARLRAGMP